MDDEAGVEVVGGSEQVMVNFSQRDAARSLPSRSDTRRRAPNREGSRAARLWRKRSAPRSLQSALRHTRAVVVCSHPA